MSLLITATTIKTWPLRIQYFYKGNLFLSHLKSRYKAKAIDQHIFIRPDSTYSDLKSENSKQP